MPRVTVTLNGFSITISSKDMQEDDSLDLSPGAWAETLGWDPVKVKKALRTLDAQQHTPRRVNCQQGQNRSPTMAVLYLWWKSEFTLGAAFDAVNQAYGALQLPLGTVKMQRLLEQLLGAYTSMLRPAWNDVRALVPGNAAELLP